LLVTLVTNLLILPVQPAVMLWGGVALFGLYHRDGQADGCGVGCMRYVSEPRTRLTAAHP